MNTRQRQLRETPRRRFRQRRGFSLAECAFSLVITAVIMVGALRAIASTHRTRTEAQARRQATELALRLLEEIRPSAYMDSGASPVFGLELGESGLVNRVSFDDVDDYASYSELTLKDNDGTAVAGSSGYTRGCSVAWVEPNNPTVVVGTDQGLKRITVWVTAPNGKTTTLVGLRSSKGLGEQRPLTGSTYVTWTGANITVGTSPPVSTGVNLTNGAQ